jgi:hypothetical protein
LVIAHFEPDGSLDPTFGNGGFALTSDGANELTAVTMAAGPNGSFVVAGYDGTPTFPSTFDTLFVQYTLVQLSSANALSQRQQTAPAPRSQIVADAAFLTLLNPVASTGQNLSLPNDTTPTPDTSSFVLLPLPVPTLSRSDIVSRLGSGGAASLAADDTLLPGDEPGRIGTVTAFPVDELVG